MGTGVNLIHVEAFCFGKGNLLFIDTFYRLLILHTFPHGTLKLIQDTSTRDPFRSNKIRFTLEPGIENEDEDERKSWI
jgi:hypothetical protein